MRAVDLALAVVERTNAIGVCLFCDSFESTRNPREHHATCPVGKYERRGKAYGERFVRDNPPGPKPGE